jgi:hypothetical protein
MFWKSQQMLFIAKFIYSLNMYLLYYTLYITVFCYCYYILYISMDQRAAWGPDIHFRKKIIDLH